MSSLTLLVPASQNEFEWFKFITKSSENTDEITELVLDFNKVKFLDTVAFVTLACLIETFYINGCTVTFIGGSSGFNMHLHNIKT